MKKKKDKINATWQQLLTEALTIEGSISDIYSRFYNYSYGNQLLLMMQGVKEPVATYNNWLLLGRQVERGTKAKAIIRPITIKNKGNDDDDFTFFKEVYCLFSYSDTKGEGEMPPSKINHEWDAEKAYNELGISVVKFEKTNGNIQGYAKDKTIAINPMAVYPYETVVHELAHVVLGHTDKTKEQPDRSIREFQAESTSFIVMNETKAVDGTDWIRAESRGYIQGWLKDGVNGRELTEAEIKPVFRAVEAILKAGREAK